MENLMRNKLLTSTSNPAASVSGNTEHEFLSNDEAASLLALSPRTLERFRLEGRGPAYCKFGRVVRYPRASLMTWVAQTIRTSTSDPGLVAA
jgi:excisionase family DNA binding protein